MSESEWNTLWTLGEALRHYDAADLRACRAERDLKELIVAIGPLLRFFCGDADDITWAWEELRDESQERWNANCRTVRELLARINAQEEPRAPAVVVLSLPLTGRL